MFITIFFRRFTLLLSTHGFKHKPWRKWQMRRLRRVPVGTGCSWFRPASGTDRLGVPPRSMRKVQLKTNATSCISAVEVAWFPWRPRTLVQWEPQGTSQTTASGVTKVEAWAEPVLYHQLAGEDWERCWQVLIWLYLEDNVNENWVLLLVQSKCRGRLRHLGKRREATWQEKKHSISWLWELLCTTLLLFLIFEYFRGIESKIIDRIWWPNIRLSLCQGRIQNVTL